MAQHDKTKDSSPDSEGRVEHIVSQKAFVTWWTKNILPNANARDLQIANQEMIEKAFMTNYEPMKNLAERLKSWDKNHPKTHQKAVEAFKAAGDMIEQILAG